MSAEQELQDLIDRLPHAARINPAHARSWIQRVRDIDPTRATWHVARAGGIGGSEIGALVASHEGRYHPFSSAFEVVKQKLLMLPPSGPTVDTKRGIELEPFIRDRFEDGLSREGIPFRHRDDLQKLIESAPHPEYPWLRASLDGIYEIDGQIWIVDFKAPSESVLEEYRRTRDFGDYTWQLHHYRKAAEGKGIHVDGLVLAMYDYRANEVVPFTVLHDPNLDVRLIEAGATYWNDYVQIGIVPELPVTPRVEATDVPEEVEQAARQFVSAKIVATAADAQVTACRAIVEQWVAREGELSGATLMLGDYMQIKGKPVPDTDAMVNRLVELGLREHEIERLRLPDRIDPKKALAAFQSLMAASRDILHAAQDGGEVLEGAIAILRDAVAAAPVKEKSAFDESLLHAALVSCGEGPDKFVVEKLSSALPRKRIIGLAERRDDVEERFALLVEEASRPWGLEGDQEPESQTMGMTS